MSLVTSHYYSLSCNGRVDNIVNPVCDAKSRGAWHDSEAMEAAALAAGWARHGKGHLCPTCAAAAKSDPVEEVGPAKPKRSRAARPVDDAPVPDWTSDQAVGQ